MLEGMSLGVAPRQTDVFATTTRARAPVSKKNAVPARTTAKARPRIRCGRWQPPATPMSAPRPAGQSSVRQALPPARTRAPFGSVDVTGVRNALHGFPDDG